MRASPAPAGRSIRGRAVKDPLADVAPELRAGLMRRNPELAHPPGMNYTGAKDLRYLSRRSARRRN